jgi:hypothetical protein
MPKKKLTDLTTDEVLRKLFPAPVVYDMKEAARAAERKAADRVPDPGAEPSKPRRPSASRIIKPKRR